MIEWDNEKSNKIRNLNYDGIIEEKHPPANGPHGSIVCIIA